MPTSPAKGTGPEAAFAWLTPPVVVGAVLLLGAFVLMFRAFLLYQHRSALGNPADWGHSWLVPLISVYLVYQQRDRLTGATIRPFWPGLLAVLLGIAADIFGAVGIKNYMVQGWAAVLTIFGVVLTLFGPRVTAVVTLPIAYLLTGIVISEMIMIKVTASLQVVASEGSYLVLQMMGITADLKGTTITVFDSAGKSYPLNIAEACSGLRMLIAFVALGGAVALVGCRYWWQRVALVALAIPIALFINIMRVVVLAIASFYNANLASGEAHTFIGTILLIPGFLLYMLILWILNRVVVAAPAAGAPAPRRRMARPTWRALRAPAYLACLVLLAVSAAGFSAASSAAKIYLSKLPIEAEGDRKVSAVPEQTPHWVRIGEDRLEDAATVETLGTNNYLNRTYIRRDSQDNPMVLDLHLAYYTGMVDTVPHVPDRCFVGAGMQISGESKVVPLAIDQSDWVVDREVPADLLGRVFEAKHPYDPKYTDFPGVRVRMPLAPEPVPEGQWRSDRKVPLAIRATPFADPDSKRSVVAGYFFIANGSTVASAEGVRLLAFDLTADYAYYLKVQVSCTQVKTPEELAEQASSLLAELLPEIMRCVPDWVRVQTGEYPSDNPRRGKNPAPAS